MSPKNRSKASFEHVCSLLDFSKNNGLVTAEYDTADAYLRHILSDTIKKLGIDAIFFLFYWCIRSGNRDYLAELSGCRLGY